MTLQLPSKIPPINTELSNNSSITCHRCGASLGRSVAVGEDELFQIGSLIVKELHGNCAQCGDGFHYSVSEKRLEKLIQRVIGHRKYSTQWDDKADRDQLIIAMREQGYLWEKISETTGCSISTCGRVWQKHIEEIESEKSI